MEKAFNCNNCNAVNLIDNTNQDYNGTCFTCGQAINIMAAGIGPDTIVGNRYQIRDLAEEGTLSDLYFAADLSTNDLILLRIYCWDYSYSISDPEEFLYMAESISHLAQPSHVKLIDYGIDDDLMYTVWPGDSIESLDRVLQIHQVIEPEVAVSICREIGRCLAKVQKETGIGHFDLNPKNLFVSNQGLVKVAGLGFTCQLFMDENFMDAEVEYYDWQYQSPEIHLGWHEADIRSDLYSLGMCLYTLVTGNRPFGRLKPVSPADYEKVGFTRADEYRLGEHFIDLYNGLTATEAAERFHSWADVLNFMDFYLEEEALVKNSAMSGRMRSMSTSYDLDYFKEKESVHPPIKIKTGKKRKSMTAAEMRKNQNFHVSEQPEKVPGKTIRPNLGNRKKKKKSDNTVPIIVSVAAVLFIILMVVIASQKGPEPGTSRGTQGSGTQASGTKANGSKKNSTKNANNSAINTGNPDTPKVVKENKVPNPGNSDKTELEAFNDIKFKIRELSLRRKWDDALNICASYKGPHQAEIDKLKAEVTKRRIEFLEGKIARNNSEKDPETGEITPAVPTNPNNAGDEKAPIVEGADIETLAKRIYKAQIELALAIIPSVEEKEKIDLDLLKKILEDGTEEKLDALLAENYLKEIGNELTLTIDGIEFKGTLLQVSPINKELKLNVVFQTRKLERIYPFSKISISDNVKRIAKNDLNETSLLQFIYLVRKKEYEAAQKSLLNYNGPLKKEIFTAMQEYKNEKALSAWNLILNQIDIDGSLSDEKFVDALTKVKINDDDAWVFYRGFTAFKKAYGTSPFYQKVKHLADFIDQAFIKQVSAVKKPDVIVSANNEPGTLPMEAALREIRDGGLIRILPGVYPGNYNVEKKIRLFGAKNVIFNDTLTIATDRVEVRNITFEKGFVDVYRKVRDVRLYGLFIKNDGIVMRGENSGILIENTLMKGLRLSTNRLMVIKDCVILEHPQNSYTVKGFLSGQVSNSIIRSNNDYAFSMPEKIESTLSVKHSIIFGAKGIAWLANDKLSIQDEKEFNRKAGRAMFIKVVQPSFTDELNYDYRLKDFSPGFFDGEDKKCIGIQYNYSK